MQYTIMLWCENKNENDADRFKDHPEGRKIEVKSLLLDNAVSFEGLSKWWNVAEFFTDMRENEICLGHFIDVLKKVLDR